MTLDRIITPHERILNRLSIVCAEHKITIKTLLGRSQRVPVVAVRKAAAEALVREFRITQSHAARILNRDHTSIHRLLATPERRQRRLEKLRRRVEARAEAAAKQGAAS